MSLTCTISFKYITHSNAPVIKSLSFLCSPLLISSGTREDSHHKAPLHTSHKTKQPAGAPVGSNFLSSLGLFSYPIITSSHQYFSVSRKFQKGKAVKNYLNNNYCEASSKSLHNVWDFLLIQELFMGHTWWDPVQS